MESFRPTTSAPLRFPNKSTMKQTFPWKKWFIGISSVCGMLICVLLLIILKYFLILKRDILPIPRSHAQRWELEELYSFTWFSQGFHKLIPWVRHISLVLDISLHVLQGHAMHLPMLVRYTWSLVHASSILERPTLAFLLSNLNRFEVNEKIIQKADIFIGNILIFIAPCRDLCSTS